MPAALRCAIYARVSVADTQNAGLTSLDAQIEACEQYIVLRSAAEWR
jgi:DNA invertase Pin-like site-specific DNA recombinase